MLSQCFTGMGSTLHCRCPGLDIVPGMAMDAHRFLRASWACHAYETAQLCLL
jgi:hypothetical protein